MLLLSFSFTSLYKPLRPPVRCAEQKDEQNIVSTKPFVYMLSLVHAGMKEAHGGVNNAFVTTGDVDDFMPVLHFFQNKMPLESTKDTHAVLEQDRFLYVQAV